MELISTTLIPHGRKNEDGGERNKHCPGVWSIYQTEPGDLGAPIVAICTECDEIRDLSKPLHP
jgi:hypothetical protein